MRLASPGAPYLWLDEARFMALPRRHRSALVRAQHALGREIVPSVRAWFPVTGDAARAQADGHRFVWWRSLLDGVEEPVLTDYIEEGRRPSRHAAVPEWLAGSTRPGGLDDDPGTVLVWRSPDGLVQHAAVTLGGGWALHKPSQGWMSPNKVLTVEECKASSRSAGRRLERRSLLS